MIAHHECVAFALECRCNVPLVEQGRTLPQERLQVGTGSRQEVLDWSGDRRAERGVAPQGQAVTCAGRRGHGGQGAGWQLSSHRWFPQFSSLEREKQAFFT